MVAFAAMTMFGLSSCEDDPVEPNNSNNTNGQTGDLTGYAAMLPGTWRMDGLAANGQQIPTDAMDITLQFNTDGTGLMSDNGVTENNDFRWAVEGNQIDITPRNGVTMHYTIDTINASWAIFHGTGWPGFETAEVEVKIVKIGNVQPTPGPQPGPDTNNVSLAGTVWVSAEAAYDVTISFLTETHCSFHQVDSGDVFDYRGTYTFNGISGTMTFTILGAITETLTFTISGNTMTATFDGDTYRLTRSNNTPAPVVNELTGTMWKYGESGAGEGGFSMTSVMLVFTSSTECTYIYTHDDSSMDEPVEMEYDGTYTYANGGGELNFGDNGTGYFSIRENQMDLQFNGNVTLSKYTAKK